MTLHGSCLCGAVRFEVQGALPAPDACHCTQCRKQTGHYLVSADVKRDKLTLHGEERVTWYASSPKVRRGFCGVCGATLFWDPVGHDWIGIAMGAFDGPTNTQIHVHIFMDSKGDYYEVNDGAPQFATVPPRTP